MLILLPPSEGKIQPKGRSTVSLSTLTFPVELFDTRSKLLSKALAKSPVASAIALYSGVLYQALDWSSLSAMARKRGEKSILIISALFGALRPADQIPNYKVKIKTSDWKGVLKPPLDGLGADLIIDCRSSTYSAVWQPDPMKTIAVRVFKNDKGKISVITHLSKKYRGELTRLLLKSTKAPKTPEQLLEIAATEFNCKLHKAKDGQPWYLDLIIG